MLITAFCLLGIEFMLGSSKILTLKNILIKVYCYLPASWHRQPMYLRNLLLVMIHTSCSLPSNGCVMSAFVRIMMLYVFVSMLFH